MKKKVLTGAALVIIAACGFLVSSTMENYPSRLMQDNIQALANTEDGGGKLVCYSESRVKQGETYINCNDCCKTYNEKPKGSQSKCKGTNPPCEKS